MLLPPMLVSADQKFVMKLKLFKRAQELVEDLRKALEEDGLNPELANRVTDCLFAEMVHKTTRYDLEDSLSRSILKLLAPSCCQREQDKDKPWFEWKKGKQETQAEEERILETCENPVRATEEETKQNSDEAGLPKQENVREPAVGADGGRKRADCCWRPWNVTCPFTVHWLRNDMLKVIGMPPVEMAKDLQDLEYLTLMITELKDPASSEAWLDYFGTWKSVRDLTSVMHPEMCQIILQCIFSDPQVIKGIEFVEPFEVIEGKPPSGLLTKMKQVSKSPASTHARTYIHTLIGVHTHADPWEPHEVPGVRLHPGASNRSGAHQSNPRAPEPPRELGGLYYHVRVHRTGHLHFDVHLRKVLRRIERSIGTSKLPGTFNKN